MAADDNNRPYTKKLWDGYEVSLGPARNGEVGAGNECTAAIYAPGARVVFRTTGYSVIFEEGLTGQDFDGDGKGEVVFQTDTGGGNHCCWAYNVVSLSPKPHRVAEIAAPGAVEFKKDDQGRLAAWVLTPGPYGFTSMASQPFATKVLRVREGKLVDVTPQFSRQLVGEDEPGRSIADRNKMSSDVLKSLAAGVEPDEDTTSELLANATQEMFCRHYDHALYWLDLWPKATQADMKAKFAVSIEKIYPDFAARLRSLPVKH